MRGARPTQEVPGADLAFGREDLTPRGSALFLVFLSLRLNEKNTQLPRLPGLSFDPLLHHRQMLKKINLFVLSRIASAVGAWTTLCACVFSRLLCVTRDAAVLTCSKCSDAVSTQHVTYAV